MKLSRILEAGAGLPSEPVAAPSNVHIRFVKLLGQLSRMGKSTGHPAATLMSRLLPSMLRDIAEVPPEKLATICREVGKALLDVADDELGEEYPELPPLELGEGGADEPGPAVPALAQGPRG